MRLPSIFDTDCLKKSNYNIVFLDFDGPISTEKAWVSNNDKIITNRSIISLAENSEKFLDETCCRLINKVVTSLDVYIVISSAWRTFFPLEKLKEFLLKKGNISSERIIGCTPYLKSERGYEIKVWLKEFKQLGYDVDSYVAIDDNIKDIEIMHDDIHVLQTKDEENGISLSEFNELKNKFVKQLESKSIGE